MVCVQAKSLLVCGIDGLAAQGMWVDFGLRSLALGLHIPEDAEDSEQAGQQAELEVVEFPYGEWVGGRDGWVGESVGRGACMQVLEQRRQEPACLACFSAKPSSVLALTSRPSLALLILSNSSLSPSPCPPCPPAADVTRVQTAAGTTSGYDKLTVSLRAMPSALQLMSQSFKGWVSQPACIQKPLWCQAGDCRGGVAWAGGQRAEGVVCLP